jgi:DIS3-like exonuclease 2
MTVAEYFPVADSPSSSWGHYALSIPYYTHFTSPIRRYADVTVHRLLEEGLKLEADGVIHVEQEMHHISITDNPIPHSADRMEGSKLIALKAIAANCNERKKAAKEAQDRSDEIFFAVYLAKNPLVVTGVVIGIGEKSFTVLVPDYALRERIFVDKIDGFTSEFCNETRRILLTPSNHSHKDSHDRHESPEKTLHPNKQTTVAESKAHHHAFEIGVMSRVRLSLTATTTPPIAVKVNLLTSEHV